MKLYHYDHCPFCLRARMIIGWKNLQIEEEILANADEQKHYDLIGAKIVPILEKEDGSHMKESLDIVAYLDQNFGPILLNDKANDYSSNNPLSQWLDKASEPTRYLVHPRNIQIYTDDFPTEKDRNYYEKKKSQSIGPFSKALAKSTEYIETMAGLLKELDPPPAETPSYAHILLFPVLRSLSVVKNLSFPTNTLSYMQQISSDTKIPLMLEQAI